MLRPNCGHFDGHNLLRRTVVLPPSESGRDGFRDRKGSLQVGVRFQIATANGSGKSNLIEAIQLLRATPTGIETVFQQGGGLWERNWKGGSRRLLSVECLIDRGPAHSFFDDDSILCHSSTLTEVSNYPRICEDNISGAAAGSRSLSHAEVELLSSNVSARHTERGRATTLRCGSTVSSR